MLEASEDETAGRGVFRRFRVGADGTPPLAGDAAHKVAISKDSAHASCTARMLIAGAELLLRSGLDPTPCTRLPYARTAVEPVGAKEMVFGSSCRVGFLQAERVEWRGPAGRVSPSRKVRRLPSGGGSGGCCAAASSVASTR